MHTSTGISPERWSTRLIDRLAYAHDASMYRLVPEAVVRRRLLHSEPVVHLSQGNP